jgi:signal transduction histidine kinase
VVLPLGYVPQGELDLEAWLRPVNSVVVGAAQWYTRPRSGALITVFVAAAVLTGSALVSRNDWYLSAGDAVTLLWQGALSRCLVVLVSRSARLVDDLTEAVAGERRTTQLAAARRADEERHLCLVHDTVAATLTAAAARGAGGRELLERARTDLAQLSLELHSPTPDATEAFPALARATGPGTIHVTTVQAGLEQDPERWAKALREMPAHAVQALAAARDEALRNVEKHAGTDRARVELRQPPNGGVEVVVIDEGRGFEPGAGRGEHFGVQLSIEARMRRAGGSSRVVSTLGRGTRVELRWPAERPASEKVIGETSDSLPAPATPHCAGETGGRERQ